MSLCACVCVSLFASSLARSVVHERKSLSIPMSLSHTTCDAGVVVVRRQKRENACDDEDDGSPVAADDVDAAADDANDEEEGRVQVADK